MTRAGARSRRHPASALASLSDEELLGLRVCDLDLSIEGTPLEQSVSRLYDELDDAGFLHFRPKVYLGDEWFSPDGVPAISIPFWLTHPRLKKLERRHMAKVEGETTEWCMRLLRHETGHCFDHAYEVSKSRQWRRLFGDPALPYDAEHYEWDETSRDYVVHLEDHYAQCHPEEDFAETFAVVLDPASDWTRRYARWPVALAKLRYVEGLIARLGPRRPKNEEGPLCYKASRIRRTVARYYQDRLKEREG